MAAEMTANTATTATFFNALFQPGDGWIELRALPSLARTFVKPGDIAGIQRFVQHHWDEDCYFGVASRKDSTSGRLENCSVVRAVFADIDFKTYSSEDAAIRAIESFPLTPSFMVHSGGGLHVYWLLSEPVVLPYKAAAFRELLRRTAAAIGADMASAEPARVLRIPGTLNHKYTPAREVRLIV